MALNTADVGLMAFQKFLDIVRSGSTKSLTEYTRNFRAEPFVMIDSECVFLDEMSDVMQSLQSQYAGFYMLAMSTLTTINNVQVSSHMAKLNPSRSTIDAAANSASAAAGFYFAAESYKDGLAKVMGSKNNKDLDRNREVDVITGGAGRNAAKEIAELSNLSVGKIFTCEIQDGNTKIEIPIQIRLMANSLPAENLVHILAGGQVDKGIVERYHAWRAGRLSLSDMLFCNDLVDAYYKNALQDKDGIFRNITQRRRSNGLAAILSGSPSVGTFSNMAVITETTAKQVELALNGRTLKDYRTREKLFDKTALMILAVVDRDWKRVTFYYQGISRHNDVSFRDLKNSNKGSGPDVAEILNAYRLGTNPVI